MMKMCSFRSSVHMPVIVSPKFRQFSIFSYKKTCSSQRQKRNSLPPFNDPQLGHAGNLGVRWCFILRRATRLAVHDLELKVELLKDNRHDIVLSR